jgi:hypothetical protein
MRATRRFSPTIANFTEARSPRPRLPCSHVIYELLSDKAPAQALGLFIGYTAKFSASATSFVLPIPHLSLVKNVRSGGVAFWR